MKRLFFVLILPMLIAGLGNAHAVQPDEVLKDAQLEQRARNLSAGLRCVVCQNQTIDDSDAPLARDLRLLVRERLVAGDSDAQVIDFVVARYGEFVLLKPRFAAHTLVLWLLPLFVLSITGFLLWRRSRARAANPAGPPVGARVLSADEEARLGEVLETDPSPHAKE
ncbi:MAG: cytochrome c-type biogenesis protein [Hyphomicrobiaceae bacterium]